MSVIALSPKSGGILRIELSTLSVPKHIQLQCLIVCKNYMPQITIKILKFGTPQTIAISVLKLVKFDVTLH